MCFVGKPVVTTWTLLSETAVAGSSTVILQVPVEWKVGDYIVIASTGHHASQHENEKRRIKNVNEDQNELTLAEPLEYTHLGVTG